MSARATKLPDDERPPQTTTQAADGLPQRRFCVAEIEAFVASKIIPECERFEAVGIDGWALSLENLQSFEG